MQPSPILAQFTAKTSSAGDVYVELGFVPDYVRVIIATAGTNSNVAEWYNPATVTMYAAGYLLTTGSTGVRTVVTTSGQIIEAYTGGDKISTAETTNSTPKHVNNDGTAAAAGHVTAQGVLIPAELQVAGGVHIVEAYRLGR